MGLQQKGIDELYRLLDAADRHNDKDLMEAVEKELNERDIDGYNQRQAEARFGA